ncbi:MAG TPA: metallophosphoesterase [Anaerolineales bacterium]|nr:metallophosphoesterase [Anaerolineales bacterium]
MAKGKKLSRRDFLKILKAGALGFASMTLGIAGYGYLMEPGWVVIERINLKLKRLSPAFSGIRIAQISDIHMGGWMNVERFQQVVDKVIGEDPDILLVTGDYLLGHDFNEDAERNLQELTDILTQLTGTIPTYGILGNHDYWTNAKAVRAMLRASGVIELTNSVFTLSRGNAKLHLCGVDDIWEGDVRLDSFLDQLPEDGAAILLAHEPDFADVSAATGRFDLQVSGHSHGGQVVIPFYGPPVLPYLGEKYPIGLYKIGEMFQYTNRGVGMASLPVRINCPPEITIFTLECPE